MEELNKKLSEIVIDKIFLAKTLIAIFAIYLGLLLSNIYYSQKVYEKILENIDKKEVMVIDHNGNKTFERVGSINLDIVALFAKQSLRRILELSYENKFALFYARSFVSKEIFEELEKNYEGMYNQLKIENGYYSLNIKNMELLKSDEVSRIYDFLIAVELEYFFDGGKKTEKKNIEIRVSQNKNVENDYFGLIISKLNEVEIVEE